MPAFPRTFREKQALQQARTIAALCASSHPQGRRFPVHRQVSRLGFLRRNTFPAIFRQWLHRFLGTRSLVCFTVAGTAPVLHRLPMLAEHARVRRRASLRTCVGCSFVMDIIHADGALVNLLRFLDTFPAICYNSDGRNRSRGFHPFVCISFRTQGASSLFKPKSSMDNPVSPVTIKIKQHGSPVRRALPNLPPHRR